jgi:hypothetical protein
VKPLATFVASAAAVVAALAAFNWWLDPLGQFWDAGALAAAAERGCVISDDLVGTSSWLPFKEDVVALRRPRTIVVGTSRVLEMSGGAGFANAGMPGTGTETLVPLFRRVHALDSKPLTVYVGVELFWLNRAWQPNVVFGQGLRKDAKYVLARQTLAASARLARTAPSTVLSAWTVERTRGGRYPCVVDRGGRASRGEKDAWATDGSFVYRQELGGEPVRDDEYTRDLVDFTGPYYRDWHELDAERVAQLDDALALARSYGWRVVGYTPPYSSRYSARIREVFPRLWSEFARDVGDAFRANGYRWVDLRRVEDVPCAGDAFADDGWHPDATCSARIAGRLARVADE